MLETVVFVCKRVVVFKTVVLFEVIIGREDDTTDPFMGNEREKCICIALSHVSSVDCVARSALKRGEGKKGTQRLFRNEGGNPAAREYSFLANNRIRAFVMMMTTSAKLF